MPAANPSRSNPPPTEAVLNIVRMAHALHTCAPNAPSSLLHEILASVGMDGALLITTYHGCNGNASTCCCEARGAEPIVVTAAIRAYMDSGYEDAEGFIGRAWLTGGAAIRTLFGSGNLAPPCRHVCKHVLLTFLSACMKRVDDRTSLLHSDVSKEVLHILSGGRNEIPRTVLNFLVDANDMQSAADFVVQTILRNDVEPSASLASQIGFEAGFSGFREEDAPPGQTALIQKALCGDAAATHSFLTKVVTDTSVEHLPAYERIWSAYGPSEHVSSRLHPCQSLHLGLPQYTCSAVARNWYPRLSGAVPSPLAAHVIQFVWCAASPVIRLADDASASSFLLKALARDADSVRRLAAFTPRLMQHIFTPLHIAWSVENGAAQELSPDAISVWRELRAFAAEDTPHGKAAVDAIIAAEHAGPPRNGCIAALIASRLERVQQLQQKDAEVAAATYRLTDAKQSHAAAFEKSRLVDTAVRAASKRCQEATAEHARLVEDARATAEEAHKHQLIASDLQEVLEALKRDRQALALSQHDTHPPVPVPVPVPFPFPGPAPAPAPVQSNIKKRERHAAAVEGEEDITKSEVRSDDDGFTSDTDSDAYLYCVEDEDEDDADDDKDQDEDEDEDRDCARVEKRARAESL